MKTRSRINRRRFLGSAAAVAATAAIVPRHVVAGSGQTPPSDKLRLAFIGVGGRGATDLKSLADLAQHVVALCDVDQDRAAASLAKYSAAKQYHDYRESCRKTDS